MENFCDTLFWDSNITWESGVLELTPCFQDTILIWFPYSVLWLFCGIEIHLINTSRYQDIPWKTFNISKIVILIVLIILTLAELVINIIDSNRLLIVDILNPIIKIITFCLAGVLLRLDKKNGKRISVTLFLFWFLVVICGIPQFRNVIDSIQDTNNNTLEQYRNIYYIIYLLLTTIQFVLSGLADAEPTYTTYKKSKSTNPTPFIKAGIFNRILFVWLIKLIYKGFRNPLDPKEVYELTPDSKTNEVYDSFQNELNNFYDNGKRKKTQLTSSSLLKITLKSIGGKLLLSAVFGFILMILEIMTPLVLQLLIKFIPSNEPLWKGILYATLFLVLTIGQSLTEAQQIFYAIYFGLKVKTTFLMAIYRKALKKLNVSLEGLSTGEIVNLMSVDAQRFIEIPFYINTLWFGPIQIILIMIILWTLLGPSILAGFAVLLSMFPISLWISRKLKGLQTSQMVFKGQRIKIINEMLNGIKVLKLQAWEPSFEAQVKEIREKEIKTLKTAAIYSAIAFFVWTMAPYLVSLAAFATYVLVDEKNELTTEKAFVSIALINILKYPMYLFSMLVTLLTQANVSLKRIAGFLNSEDLDPDNVTHKKSENSIEIKNGIFSWYENKRTLENINIQVAKGQLVAIVGRVGSGKSSLISAILGEMDKLTGTVNTDGKIAYVPQQAWIQNCTLQQNITFGQQLEKDRYNRVIEACALIPDLKILPGGDQIEIGEKGINLSGGQKQRISLARAVYSDADIYLLDDPLSAVDSHVGKHIFENVLSENGVLAGKTRFLVTHAVTILPRVDQIFVMSGGQIIESGSYKELVAKQEAFSDFLEEYTNDVENEEEIQSKNKSTQLFTEDKTSVQRNDDNKEIFQLTKEESVFTGSINFKVYLRYVKNAGVFISVTCITSIIVYQVFAILTNISLTNWSEDPESGKVENRDRYLAIYAGLGILQGIFILITALSIAIASITTTSRLHNLLTSTILKLPILFFDMNPLGRIMNRFSKDIDSLDNYIPHFLRRYLIALSDTIAIFVVIGIATPLFVAFVLPICLIYYLLQRFYISTFRQLKRLESIWRSPIYSHFGETLSGLPVIRATQQQDRFIIESEDKIDFNQKFCFSFYSCNRWLSIGLQCVGAGILLIAALFAVFSRSEISAALAALSLTYALQVSQSLRVFVRMTSELDTHIVAVERIEEYLNVPQEAAWETKNINPTWPENGVIEFLNLQFRYREGLDLALKGISFSVKSQEKIGIVGRTGAGKSSLTLALFRIVEPAGGSIVIDGVDISELGLHTLRSRLTIIPQDPVLFSGTLRLNLDPFQSYSDEAIWMALEHSHLKTFVQSLPKGLNHEISENGENLSVGQRQLVCLARALLKKTKILILDEATAAIDVETDELIQQTIRNQFADCTILTIAHRINTILDSDRILLLENGIIAEFDSPEVLLNDKSSKFYSLAKEAGVAVKF